MARKATLIYRDWLTSITLNNADDMTECIALRLLLASDDYGRLTYRSTNSSTVCPTTLKIALNDFRHTPQQIEEVVTYLIAEGCLKKYEIEGFEYLRWVKWEDYQNIQWRDDAKCPAPDGAYEISNNPQTIKKRADKQSVQRTGVTKGSTRHVQEEEKKKESGKPKPHSKYVMMVSELFPEMSGGDAMVNAATLEEIERIDGKSMDGVMPALRWAAHDESSFWHGNNFDNCKTLRKRKDGRATPMKYVKIVRSYKKTKVSNVPKIQ